MTIQVKATNFELTPSIQTKVEEKLLLLEKHLARFDDQSAILARVEVGKTTNHHNKGDVYKASVHLEIPGEPNLRAEAVESDLHVAIDAVQADLDRELRRSHGKHQDTIIRSAREAKQTMQQLAHEIEDEE